MPSNATKGAYYKNRTRRWLQSKEYCVADMEMVRWIYTKNGTRVPVKRDQFGADLLAMNANELIFVQCKSGAIGGNFPEAKRKFAEYTFPLSAVVKCWIVAWAPRARAPRIVEC